VNIRREMVGKSISLFIVCLLLFTPLLAHPCQRVYMSKSSGCCCCCKGSGSFSPKEDKEEQKCPCQMAKKQQEETSPAVIVSHHNGEPETLLMASEVEVITKDYFTQFPNLCHHPLLPTSKDPPLYLLHSSFLI
jgi:hypothetical protein